MFFLSASNPGFQTVTLTGCGIILPNKKQLVPIQAEGEVRLPYSLEGGKSCTFWMSIPEVVDAIKRARLVGTISIKAFFRDANGKEYYSKPFRGDVSEWAKVK